MRRFCCSVFCKRKDAQLAGERNQRTSDHPGVGGDPSPDHGHGEGLCSLQQDDQTAGGEGGVQVTHAGDQQTEGAEEAVSQVPPAEDPLWEQPRRLAVLRAVPQGFRECPRGEPRGQTSTESHTPARNLTAASATHSSSAAAPCPQRGASGGCSRPLGRS